GKVVFDAAELDRHALRVEQKIGGAGVVVAGLADSAGIHEISALPVQGMADARSGRDLHGALFAEERNAVAVPEKAYTQLFAVEMLHRAHGVEPVDDVVVAVGGRAVHAETEPLEANLFAQAP